MNLQAKQKLLAEEPVINDQLQGAEPTTKAGHFAKRRQYASTKEETKAFMCRVGI